MNGASDLRRARRAMLDGVYAVVEPERAPLEPFVESLLRGGVRLFQVRAKGGIARERLVALVARVRAAQGIILVNDDVALAELADGVHLGQEDAALHDVPALRRRLPDAIVGLSCGTPAEGRAADPALFDYIGVGPIFATGSKHDAGGAIGVNGVRAVVAAAALPAAAIGGIDVPSIPRVRESGAAMAAVISALYAGSDAALTAAAFVRAWTS